MKTFAFISSALGLAAIITGCGGGNPGGAADSAGGTRAAGKPTVNVINGEKVYKGAFLGVFDGKGKNLAVHGAREVHTDLKTGAIVSVR